MLGPIGKLTQLEGLPVKDSAHQSQDGNRVGFGGSTRSTKTGADRGTLFRQTDNPGFPT